MKKLMLVLALSLVVVVTQVIVAQDKPVKKKVENVEKKSIEGKEKGSKKQNTGSKTSEPLLL